MRTATNRFDHSSDIEFKRVINLYKKITARPFSFLIIDTTQNFFYILERIV